MKKTLLLSILAITLTMSGCSLASNNTSNNRDASKPATSIQVEEVNTTVSGNATINLSGKNLDKIPSSTFEKTNTETLDISNNRLTGALPGEIRFLKNLKTLKANNNLMTGVPAEVGQLGNLEILDLSNNQLTGLPQELGNLKNLKTMNLSGNTYSEQDLKYIQERLPNTTFISK